jgi:hypothetical protein
MRTEKTYTIEEVKQIALMFTRAATPSKFIHGIEERFNKVWKLNFGKAAMTTEKLTAVEILGGYLKSTNLTLTELIERTALSQVMKAMEAFARQEVEPIEKQRDELLEACKSSFKTLAAIGCNMEAEIIKVLETAIKNAER